MDEKIRIEKNSVDENTNAEHKDTVSANDLLGKLKKNIGGKKKKNRQKMKGDAAASEETDLYSEAESDAAYGANADVESVMNAYLGDDDEFIRSDDLSSVESDNGVFADFSELFAGEKNQESDVIASSVDEYDDPADNGASSDVGIAEADETALGDVGYGDFSETDAEASDELQPQEDLYSDEFDAEDGGVDETDVQLMVAFGMEDELAKTVGFDKAAELSENADMTGKIIIPHKEKKKKEPKEELEFTSADQVGEILSGYKTKYRLLLLRMLACFVILVFTFLYENLGAFGASLPNWMDSVTYPVVYTMFGLQLLVLGGALVWNRLRDGALELARLRITPDGAMTVTVGFSVLYNIIMCLTHLHSAPHGIRFFNLPVILMIMMSLVGEYMDFRRELTCFKVVSSKKHKFAIESLSETQATLETNAFAGFMPEDASIFRISETEFVDGFYSRMRTTVSGQRILNILVPISVIAALAFFVWDLIIDRSFESAITVAQYTLCFGMPFIVMLVFSLPFFTASKIAGKSGSAIIGGCSLEEYCTTSSAITFEDKDVFPASGVMVKSIKTYGDSRIDYIIYNVASLFMKVGGPLADVFASAAGDMEHSDDVKLTKVVSGGLEAYISDAHIYCGNADFFTENGLEVPYDPEDEILRDEGAVSVMLLAIDGEVVAKLYVQYMLDRDFEVTLKQLSKLGICVGIKTFDPNITDVMLNRKVRLDEYPIKILRCRTIDDMAISSEHVESGVVSKRSVKSMMQAYSLCEKVLHAMKTGVMLKILSMAFAFVIIALLLLIGVGGSVYSYHAALYQLIWIIPTVFITKLYVNKN